MTTSEFFTTSVETVFESYKNQSYRKLYYAYLDKGAEIIQTLEDGDENLEDILKMITSRPKLYVRTKLGEVRDMVNNYELRRVLNKIDKNLMIDVDFWDHLNDFCDNFGK
jgi:hypothetical protein